MVSTETIGILVPALVILYILSSTILDYVFGRQFVGKFLIGLGMLIVFVPYWLSPSGILGDLTIATGFIVLLSGATVVDRNTKETLDS